MSAAALRADAGEPTPHLLTVDDVRAMAVAGIIDEGAKVELIEGVLYDMPADGELNLDWADWLGRWLYRELDDRYRIIPGMTLRLSDLNGPKPDWWISLRSTPVGQVRGPDVLLAIEQSDSTVAYDLGRKADLYAVHGIRDYWTIDLKARRALVHRDPGRGRYPPPRVATADQAIDALLIPGLRLRLADLPLGQ